MWIDDSGQVIVTPPDLSPEDERAFGAFVTGVVAGCEERGTHAVTESAVWISTHERRLRAAVRGQAALRGAQLPKPVLYQYLSGDAAEPLAARINDVPPEWQWDLVFLENGFVVASEGEDSC